MIPGNTTDATRMVIRPGLHPPPPQYPAANQRPVIWVSFVWPPAAALPRVCDSLSIDGDPGYMIREVRKFGTDRYVKQMDVLSSVTHATPAVYMSYMSQISFVLRIEFIRYKLSNFSVHVSGVAGRSPSTVVRR